MKKIFQKFVWFFALHCLLLLYSLSNVASKLAAEKEFFSLNFLILYGTAIFILGIYAIFWQQILKKIPLITAYANKSVTVIWGMLFGAFLFHEQITWNKVIGVLFIIGGVYFVVSEDAAE